MVDLMIGGYYHAVQSIWENPSHSNEVSLVWSNSFFHFYLWREKKSHKNERKQSGYLRPYYLKMHVDYKISKEISFP